MSVTPCQRKVLSVVLMQLCASKQSRVSFIDSLLIDALVYLCSKIPPALSMYSKYCRYWGDRLHAFAETQQALCHSSITSLHTYGLQTIDLNVQVHSHHIQWVTERSTKQ
eukprot:3879115-Rhodomonas_salina.1